MRIVCPVCKAVHRIKDGHAPSGRAVGKCMKCGAQIVIDPEQVKMGSSSASDAASEAALSEKLPVEQAKASEERIAAVEPQLKPPAHAQEAASEGGSARKRSWKGFALAGCLAVLILVVFVQFVLPNLPMSNRAKELSPRRTAVTPQAGSSAELPAGPGGAAPAGGAPGKTPEQKQADFQTSPPPHFPRQDPNLDALISACRSGDLEQVRSILDSHPDLDVNSTGSREGMALSAACGGGNVEVVNLLLAKGADAKVPGAAPLVAACMRGSMEIARILIERGAEINDKGSFGPTPLIAAASAGNVELVKYLIAAGADLQAVDGNRYNALMMAASRGKADVVELLIQSGADMSVRDTRGDTILGLAIRGKSKPELLQFLLEKGCELESKDSDGRTPLVVAAQSGNMEAVELLLDKGARIDSQDNFGSTPLGHAVQAGNPQIVELLIKRGASIDVRDAWGASLLAKARSPEVREMLLSYGAVKPESVTTETFKLVHALPYDKRLVKGLESALTQYAQFFVKKQGVSKPVQVSVSQLNDSQYRVSFALGLGGKDESCEVALSTQSQDVRDNIRQLERELKRFAEASGNGHHRKGKKPLDHQELVRQLSEQISHFDYFDMLSAIQLAEQKIADGDAGARLFYNIGEVYAWLAFFKNENENRRLSDLLAAQAVSGYLLGSLEEQAGPDRSFYEGLLLLALGYPAAAEEALNTSDPAEQLLHSFIRYDFEQMKALAASPKVNKRLLGYLLARASNRSGQEDVANELYFKLMTNYPDFLLAEEYVVGNGNVGARRQYIYAYLTDLLEKHLAIVDELTETKWVAQDRQLEQEASKAVSLDNAFEKWLKVHFQIVSHSPRMKSAGRALPGSLLSEFLKEDMFNAVMIWHELEDKMLGRDSEANRILEMAKSVYPGKSVANILSVKHSKDSRSTVTLLGSLQIQDIPECMMVDLLKSGHLMGRQGFYYLKQYKERESPSAAGCLQLFERYNALLFRPVAEKYLSSALALDPYNYRCYEAMLKLSGHGEKAIEAGNQRIGHLYGFLIAAADYHKKNGRSDEAIALYEKAIAMSPSQQTAYYWLGSIYEGQEQFEKAIETWEAYLKFDRESLSAVEIQNAIGHLWLKKGEYSRGYDIFLESQKSGQAEAILGFAEASEKSGKILQAEKSYERAAQRYPRGLCPIRFGLFYLRQSNPEMASKVLREYKRFSHQGYYFEELIDHCAQSGKPEEAIVLVRKIEGAPPADWDELAQRLAVAYMAKKHYKIAADILKPYATGSAGRGSRGTWEMEKFWSSMIDGGLCIPQELASKAIPSYDRNMMSLETMARFLARRQCYDESLKVFGELFKKPELMNSGDCGDHLVRYAMVWTMSSRDEGVKREILDVLRKWGKDQWVESRVLFLLGESDEKKLMERAATEESQGQAYYCLGMMKLKDGNEPEALLYLMMALENMKEGQEYWHAREIAKQLSSS